ARVRATVSTDGKERGADHVELKYIGPRGEEVTPKAQGRPSLGFPTRRSHFLIGLYSIFLNVTTVPGSWPCSAKWPLVKVFFGSVQSTVFLPLTRIWMCGPSAITSCVKNSSGLFGASFITRIFLRSSSDSLPNDG